MPLKNAVWVIDHDAGLRYGVSGPMTFAGVTGLAGSQIREAISGQICRCTGYENIVRAVQRPVATPTWLSIRTLIA